MLFTSPLSEARSFLEEILNHHDISNNEPLIHSKHQLTWISICITAMVFMGMLCFAKIQQASLGLYSARAFSSMFHSSKISWVKLFECSILRLIKLFGVEGVLVVDDTDRLRAKSTKTLFGIHKLRDKKTGGYSVGQNIVVLVFVTKKMTFPVGFRFFIPDPAWTEWRKNDKILRLKKVKKSQRPKKPERSDMHPTRITIAGNLIKKFKFLVPDLKIQAICVDAAFLCKEFVDTCEALFPKVQIISQIKQNQLVKGANQALKSVKEFFKNQIALTTKISLRGGIEKSISYVNRRIFVNSHSRKLHVIALKYEGEVDYRYIVATNLSWTCLDIIRAYAQRWLIEVFFQDWKRYDGWGKWSCQRGVDGACRGVILSLLVDHFLLSHPFQLERVKAGLAALTAGSLQRYLQSKSVFDSIAQILESQDPKKALKELVQSVEKWIEFRPSDKHMTGHSIGDFLPSASLAKKFKLQT